MIHMSATAQGRAYCCGWRHALQFAPCRVDLVGCIHNKKSHLLGSRNTLSS